jgi:hypothetical protein
VKLFDHEGTKVFLYLFRYILFPTVANILFKIPRCTNRTKGLVNIVCAEVVGVWTTVSREDISTAPINGECGAEKFGNLLHDFSIEIILHNYLWTLDKYANGIRRNVKYVNTGDLIFFG